MRPLIRWPQIRKICCPNIARSQTSGELVRIPVIWWSVGVLIRTPDTLIGDPIEARFDGEKEEPRSTAEGGPALTKPGLLNRAEGAPTWWS